MPVQLLTGSTSSAGFDAPLDLLSACHERITRQGVTLQRLAAHLASQGADADARLAAANVLRYFDTAGHHHHVDEEQDLFPALFEAMAGSDAVCLHEMQQRIVHEHRELDQVWSALREQLRALTEGRGDQLDAARLTDFVARNQRHIDFEEAEVLPMARRLLSDAQLAAMGQSMRARRGG